MTTLDYALVYIRRGWSVIPLKPRLKEPAAKIASFLTGEERMTEADADYWWGTLRHEAYGIGIVTGKPSGLVVVDIDPRNGGRLDVIDEIGSELVQRTGGGGAHVFCRYPEGASVPCGKTIEPGVDRKGDGGYVVAAPSIHPSGTPYSWPSAAWIAQGRPAPLPTWVTKNRSSALSSGTQSDTQSDPWVADTLAHPESVLPGTQEETLTRLCWWAAGNLDYDIARALLCAWAQRLPLGNPHQPWTDADVDSRLDRAVEKREPQAGSICGIVDDVTPRPKVQALRDKVRPARQFVRDVEADAAAREWIAEEFIAPGCWTEVIGVMKEGKTTFVAGLLRAIISGEAYLGRACKPTSVLYVTEQVGLSFQKTLERAKLTEADALHILTIADVFGLPWPEVASTLVDIAAELDCRVIIIDTLARIAGIAEEDEAKSVSVLNPLLKARANGIAVVFIRHSRKAGGAINVAGRGSGAITGEMDVCLYITAPEGLASTYRRLEGVSRLTDTIDLHLKYEDGAYVLGEDPDTADREHRHAAVVQYLSSQGMRLVPGAEIVDALKESRSKAQVYRYLAELLEDKKVEKVAKAYRLRPKNAVTEVA